MTRLDSGGQRSRSSSPCSSSKTSVVRFTRRHFAEDGVLDSTCQMFTRQCTSVARDVKLAFGCTYWTVWEMSLCNTFYFYAFCKDCVTYLKTRNTCEASGGNPSRFGEAANAPGTTNHRAANEPKSSGDQTPTGTFSPIVMIVHF